LRPTRQAIATQPFDYYQDQHLARLKHEASLLAVPTAIADANARAERLAQWENLGWDALNVAGFFVPTVGTLMLAVTACQLLGEVFEGYEAWHEGDRHLALRHLEAVGVNLAMLSGLAVAGRVIPKLFNSPLLKTLQEVRSSDGRYRLWNQDLTPYRSDMKLPENLRPDAQGQYLHDGRCFIRMDGQFYEQRFDPELQQWRIVHPDAKDAWQPPLEHNEQGAWRGQHEQPSQWSLVRLMRRLGEDYAAFTPEQLEQAGRLCGLDAARLRQVHLEGLPTPPLLLDTLQRMVGRAKAQSLGSDVSDSLLERFYTAITPIDPATQKLLDAYPRFSPTLARRLLAPLDKAERYAWQAHDQLPAPLRQQFEQAHSELPLVRALEGLLQPGSLNVDSERLLFSALDSAPAWPADLRLELRAGSPQGPRLNQVGSDRATAVYRVIKSDDGYEADLGERPAPAARDKDLCRAVEHALPHSQHAALGIAQADGNALRQQALDWAQAHRDTLAQRLWGHRAIQREPQGGLRGGLTPQQPHPRQTSSLAGAYRRLYPNATDSEIADWLGDEQEDQQIDDMRSATQRLRDLQQRLEALQRDLQEWARPNPQRPHQRHRAIRPIINAWRRLSQLPLEGGSRLYSLNLSNLDLQDEDLASLALPDDFTHVEHISLNNNRSLSQLPAEFYECFPNLKRLLLSDCRFNRLPRLARPEQVQWLDLDNNRITWDAQAQQMLDQCAELSVLDLMDNPLLEAPDLRPLTQLRTLFLSGCALTELPQGLDLITNPIMLDLSNNQFRQLPAQFNVPTPVANALSLESEWLGEPIRTQIDTYNTAHQVDLLVNDDDYMEFFEHTGPAEAELWQRLPLQYRRGLRPLLDLEPFLSRPRQTREELWRRLRVIDTNPLLRQQWLTHPPLELLNLPL
jgi:hypothetical protein